jgi:hypothetical protein
VCAKPCPIVDQVAGDVSSPIAGGEISGAGSEVIKTQILIAWI